MRPTYLTIVTIIMTMMIATTPLLPSFTSFSINYAEGAKDEVHDTKQEHSAGKLHASSTVAGLHMELIVEPATIEPNIPVKFSLMFMDSITGEMKDTVPHTFLLMKDGNVIFEEYAEHAGYVHEFVFSEDHKGPLTVMIRDVNNTGEDAEFNITVVPEFPIAMIVMVGAITSSLLLGRRFIADKYHL